MPKVVGYHRPASLDEAVRLLAQPDTAVLAGGTRVNATPFARPVVAVDLQSLELNGVSPEADRRLRLGAMVTLQQLVDDARIPEVLKQLARREEPSTLRTLATVGGTVAAGGWESELLTGLCVGDCTVTLHGPSGERRVPLPALLADCELLRGSLIVAVSIATEGAWAAERTARTPGDRAIVSAVARRSGSQTTVAVSGVATAPVLLANPNDLSGLNPPSDFRGSGDYRRHLASVLVGRVTKVVER